MANVDAPKGFGLLNGAAVRPPTKYKIQGDVDGTAYSENLFVDDAVVLASGFLVKATAGTNNQIIGHIASFDCTNGGMKQGGYYPEDSPFEWDVFVNDDITQRFVAQDDGGGVLTIANIGETINLKITTAGNTSTNLSGMELDSSATAGAVTDQYRIIGLVDRPGNAWGVNAELIVEIHNHQLRQENNVDATT